MIKSIKAPAKINLQLDVKEKNNDNYHNIYTIMQTVSLFDTLTFNIKEDDKDSIELSCTKPYIPTDENNLCYKAIRYFKDKYNITDSIHLHIKKAIPSGGGLGGGSSDFFYTIDFLDKYYGTKMSIKEMQDICNNYGSDISYFSIGGTCICEGRGELVRKVKDVPSFFILLINPNFPISTMEIYDEYDNVERIDRSKENKMFLDMLNQSKKINIHDIAPYLYNSFEPLVIQKHPIIQDIKNMFIKNGAITSLMSGSGSTVYGIFDNYIKAKACQVKCISSTKYFNIICKPIFMNGVLSL